MGPGGRDKKLARIIAARKQAVAHEAIQRDDAGGAAENETVGGFEEAGDGSASGLIFFHRDELIGIQVHRPVCGGHVVCRRSAPAMQQVTPTSGGEVEKKMPARRGAVS